MSTTWNNQCREEGTECIVGFVSGLEGEMAAGGALGIYMCATVELMTAGLSAECETCEFEEGFPSVFNDDDLAGVQAQTCGADGDSCYFEQQTCVSVSMFGATMYNCLDMQYFDVYEEMMTDMGATVEVIGDWSPEEEEDSAFKLGATLASAAVLAALF